MNKTNKETEYYIEVVNQLKDGHNIDNPVHKDNSTLLHCAAGFGFFEVVSMLIDSGSDIDPVNLRGDTPLSIATHLGFTKMITLLLKNGADINVRYNKEITPFLDACRCGDIETLKVIMSFNPDVNQVDGFGRNALSLAISNRHGNITDYLLQTNININAIDITRRTPILWAVQYGNSKCVEELCKRGADVCVQDIEGNSLIHNAIKEGSLELVKFLESNGTKLNTINLLGVTPLLEALRKNDQTIIDYLVSNLSKGNNKSLNRVDPCPCSSGKEYMNCCLNISPKDIISKISSTPKHNFDSVYSLLNDQIKKSGWVYKDYNEEGFYELTPRYFQNYPWWTNLYVEAKNGAVQFITNITLRKPHKFENSVISMVEYINSSELNTDIKAYYGDGSISFSSPCPIEYLLDLKVGFANLVIVNTSYHLSALKPFNTLMGLGKTLYGDWKPFLDIFSKEQNFLKLFEEHLETEIGQA